MLCSGKCVRQRCSFLTSVVLQMPVMCAVGKNRGRMEFRYISTFDIKVPEVLKFLHVMNHRNC